jgi:hypothetical protein
LYFGHPLCNLTSGGEGVSGCVVSEHTRNLISAVHKGRVKSEEEKVKLSLSQKGRKKTKEQCLLNSLGHVGIKQTEETKLKRIKTLLEVGTNNDRHSYIFFSENDVFIGTRKELSTHVGIKSRDLRNLFTKSNAVSAKGWSLVNLQQLLILKEIL